jgi:hypothetical protein
MLMAIFGFLVVLDTEMLHQVSFFFWTESFFLQKKGIDKAQDGSMTCGSMMFRLQYGYGFLVPGSLISKVFFCFF